MPRLRTALVVLGCLSFAGLVTWAGGRSDPLDIDPGRHVMTGVFLADAMRELPLESPLEYAMAYYARFPALAVLHWPPCFHLLEAGLFLVLGLHAWVPQVALTLFSVLALVAIHRLGVRLTGSSLRGALAALLLATNATFFRFSHQTMLEVPALALSLLSLVGYLGFLETGRTRALILAAVSLGLALLTKESSLFIPILILLHLPLSGNLRVLGDRRVWAAAAVLMLVVGGYRVAAASVLGDRASQVLRLPSPTSLALQAEFLVEVVGLPLLALGVWGMATRGKRSRLLWLGILVTLGLGVLVRFHEPRYLFNVLPFMALGAVFPGPLGAGGRRLGLALGTAVLLFQSVALAVRPIPRNHGWAAAAEHVVNHPQGESILVHARHMGNFVFHARRLTRDFPLYILPSTKHLAYTALEAGTRDEVRVPLVETPQALFDLLDGYGVKYVLVDSREKLDPHPSWTLLRETLASDRFVHQASFPVEDGIYGDSDLWLFLYDGAGIMTNPEIRMTMGRFRGGGKEAVVPRGEDGP